MAKRKVYLPIGNIQLVGKKVIMRVIRLKTQRNRFINNHLQISLNEMPNIHDVMKINRGTLFKLQLRIVMDKIAWKILNKAM